MKKPFSWISEKDKGIYDAMNKGICQSKGDWLLFLGCDDKLFNDNTLSSIFSNPIQIEKELIIGKIKNDWQKNDSFFVKKSNNIVTPSWSNSLWIKNTLPHQGIFYKKSVFSSSKYCLQYNILADYAFNLNLYNKKIKVKIINTLVALCGTEGISKKYNWNLYKEEIKLKTTESSLLLKPFFIAIGLVKYLLKKML